MDVVATTNSVAIIRAEPHQQRATPMQTRLWLSLADSWLRRKERELARAVQQAGHEGVMEDFRQTSRG
jgi:hypothetical protein